MAHEVQWENIHVVRDENVKEIAEVSTLEEALALVLGNKGVGDLGGKYSGDETESEDSEDDTGCSWDRNNEACQIPESLNDFEESSGDPHSSAWEPHQEGPNPSATPGTLIVSSSYPGRRQRWRQTIFQYTVEQVEEMEKMFKETPNPDALARKQLGKPLNMPEVKMEMWFILRRAKDRKNERCATLQTTPPGIDKHPHIMDRENSP